MQEHFQASHFKRRRIYGIIGLLLAGFVVCCVAESAVQASGPPITRIDTVADTLHGVVIPDPYRWLEDQNSPETRQWIDQQNAYTRSIIDPLPGREYLTKRLGELLKTDFIYAPTERNGRYFLMKRTADQDQAILYLRDGFDGKDQVLVDPHLLSADHSVSVDVSDVSADGRVVAYLVRRGGADEEAILVMNVDTRDYYPDSLPPAVYFGFALTVDMSGFYYAQRLPEGPRVFYHAMGTDHAADRLIFGEGYDDEKIITCEISENGRWLLFHVYHGSSGGQIELYFQDLQNGGPITPLVNDIEARFFGQVAGDRIFIRTD